MNLEIQLNNGQSEIEGDFEFLVGLAAGTLKLLGDKRSGELSIALLSKEEMRGLNRRLRAEDYYPDVLSYELSSEPFLGEVFLSPLIAGEQGAEFGNSFEDELALLLIHGLLHLAGFNDSEPAEKERMETKQKEIFENWKEGKAG